MSTTPDRSSRATAFGLVKESEREQSGAYPIGEGVGLDHALESDAVIAELAPELVSLIPEPPPQSMRPRVATPSERAELVIEDLSLSLDNPYLASSLVPPPKRPFPLRRAVAIASGMLAAAAIGAAVQLIAIRSPHEPSQAAGGVAAPAPLAAAARVAAPAPVAPIETVAPAAVEPAVIAAPAVVAASAFAKPVEPKAAVEAVSARVSGAEAAAPAVRAPRAIIALPAPLETAVAAPSETVEAVAEPIPPANLPEYPTREQVTAGFESVRAALAQCAAGKSGTVVIKASIASSGRVAHALVSGAFDGPEGSCMARAARDAQFPAFSQSRLKVSYPFAL